ncbi:MAG: efflux RND transporter permease subunit [Alistipes sp.]|nr:efflux RND transporter permease subunit [Alistipes sp.]
MNISEYSLRNPKVVRFFLAVLLLGGVWGFVNMGKKEDSTFVIKSAVITVSYPGANPFEVEQLVTEPIEREVQSMRRIHKITSESTFGSARIVVEVEPATPPREIPQLWDELRRKTLNIRPQLPDGVTELVVSDDFGDVYGIYYGLSADRGYSWDEMRQAAQRIKTRLLTLDGVQKVTLYGEQAPVVNVYIAIGTLANFAIRPETIISTISGQNRIVNTGEKMAGVMEIEILEGSTYKSLEDIENQLLMAADGKQYRLGDVARVELEYRSPPTAVMHIDGERAIGIGVATEPEVDVVKVGDRIDALLAEIKSELPVGMSLTVLYPENRIAREANYAFLLNLAESVAIVVFIIMLAMGLRAGVVVGSSLLFSIGGTMLFMQMLGEGLNRTSLAGFIIAMGMLVDNAIVVTDNARGAMTRGVERDAAVLGGANTPKWGLLGATLIAIFSYLPLYLAPSSVAEIVKPLFVVIAVSLLLSWVLALTQTPLFGRDLLRVPAPQSERSVRYGHHFDRILMALMRHRWLTVITAVVLFVCSLWGMSAMPQNFFPSLDKPYFRADVILPEGHNIRQTERVLLEMSQWLGEQPEVRHVSVTAGGTPPRYYLASSSVASRPNFGNMLIELHSKRSTSEVEHRFEEYVAENYPDVWLRSSLFALSPVPDATIELGFVGDNIDSLVRLTSEVEKIMRDDARCANVRNSWGNRRPAWLPSYSQMKGQRIGVSRSRMAQGITIATEGYTLGEYRRGDQFMPILLKDENIDDYNLTNLQALPVFSERGNVYSVEQTVDKFDFGFDVGLIKRYNRRRVMKAQCDPAFGVNAKALFDDLQAQVAERVTLPVDYSYKVFGEQENQVESNEALGKYMPLTLLLIFITLLLLFRNYRDPIVILAMIPLIFTGVVLGLALFGKTFNFFSLLGLLGLVGMNIKNAVILVDRIAEERARGEGSAASAVLRAVRSRIVPVTLASGTTILGMLPLLFDSMFGGMAATIMGGLFVATLLTIFVLPVTYALFYGIKADY